MTASTTAVHVGPIRTTNAGARRIVLVVDEPSLCRLFNRFLTRAGYEVVEVANREQALETLHAQGRSIDLVILHLWGSRPCEKAVLEFIRQVMADLPLLLLTGGEFYDQPLPGVPFLTTPFDLQLLLDCVELLLA